MRRPVGYTHMCMYICMYMRMYMLHVDMLLLYMREVRMHDQVIMALVLGETHPIFYSALEIVSTIMKSCYFQSMRTRSNQGSQQDERRLIYRPRSAPPRRRCLAAL